jgi:hypothetical protein
MRPLYETQKHLSVEQQIADRFAERAQCHLMKLPIRYHLDYAMTRGEKAFAFAEIKTTKYDLETHDRYGGFKISLAKWSAAEQMCRIARLPFYLVVGFPDCIGYTRTTDFSHDGIVWWGRQDRGDSQDMEPAVKLNMTRFVGL